MLAVQRRSEFTIVTPVFRPSDSSTSLNLDAKYQLVESLVFTSCGYETRSRLGDRSFPLPRWHEPGTYCVWSMSTMNISSDYSKHIRLSLHRPWPFCFRQRGKLNTEWWSFVSVSNRVKCKAFLQYVSKINDSWWNIKVLWLEVTYP